MAIGMICQSHSSSFICLTISGYWSAFCPSMKKVALALFSSRHFSNSSVYCPGPSSKVRATIGLIFLMVILSILIKITIFSVNRMPACLYIAVFVKIILISVDHMPACLTKSPVCIFYTRYPWDPTAIRSA